MKSKSQDQDEKAHHTAHGVYPERVWYPSAILEPSSPIKQSDKVTPRTVASQRLIAFPLGTTEHTLGHEQHTA
jgi:hypothetical protein